MFGAFISYKREDEAFAVALEKALEDYAPPRGLELSDRRLNIFRDREDLTGSEYHAAIDRFIGDSAKLIVLCSPRARASIHINDEILRFAAAKGSQHILPVLIAGIPNNEARPEQTAEMAFPDALCQVLKMPLAAEFRGFDPTKDRVDKGRFEASWYSVLANLYDVSRSDLEQRDRKRQARIRRFRVQVAGAVAAALVGLTLWALASRQEAISRERAARAVVALAIDPERSVALAVEALGASRTPEAEEALRRAVPRSHVRHVLREHRGWIRDVAFSLRAELVATASSDGTIGIWDTATGSRRQVIRPPGPAQYVAFVPTADGWLLTFGAEDPVARLWDASTGSMLRELKGHGGGIAAAAFSPDGRHVVTASADGTARVWLTTTGEQAGDPLGHTDEQSMMTSVSFSPDGRSVLTGSRDGVARLWSLGSPSPLRAFKGHTDAISSVAFSPNSPFMVTAGADQKALEFALTGVLTRTLEGHTDQVVSASFGRDDQRTVLTFGDKTARLWPANGAVRVLAHTDWVNGADFSPDGTLAVTASEDGSVRIWDASTGHAVASLLGHTDVVFKARFSPDGRSVVTASADKTARLWTVPSLVRLRGHTDWVTSAAFSKDGRRVVTSSWDRTTRVWDAESGRLIWKGSGDARDQLNKAAFSPDGRSVVTAGTGTVARVWDVDRGTSFALEGHTSELHSAAYSHDGSQIITGGADGTVRIWDAASRTETWRASVHEGLVTSASFSPTDDRYVLTTGQDGTARVLKWGSGETVLFSKHEGIVRSGAFSPDGRLVVTAGADKTARVWQARTGEQVSVLMGHTSRLTDAAFSPDGRMVITASADTTARVWNPFSRRLLAVFDHHADLVSSASFSPDGKRVLTSSDDGTATIEACRPCEHTIDELLSGRPRPSEPEAGEP